jgi:hypothetical protein
MLTSSTSTNILYGDESISHDEKLDGIVEEKVI